MADLQTATPAAKGTKPRAKKYAFRLDMTPMVDLAFLLLTFFMLTTTFNKPTVMQLTMPAKGPGTDLPERNALTLILGKHNQVHYYQGLNRADAVPALQTTSFTATGLRQVLLRQQRQNRNTVVLIKTAPDANYQNLVDALDEMNITDQRKYALVDISQADKDLLARRGL